MLYAGEEFAQPTPHGGEVFKACREYGFHPTQILDFSSNISPLGPPLSAIRRLKRELWKIPIYPDDDYSEFRSAVARYLGLNSSENVLAGNGSIELIYLFASVRARNEKAIIPLPTFGEYERAFSINGGTVINVPCHEDLHIDTDEILSSIKDDPCVLFLCNPNNPTSFTLPKRDLLRLIERASEKDVKVLIDETFMEFIDDRDASLSSRVEEFPNILVIRSLTKFFALTGLRIGYGVASRRFVRRLQSAKMPWAVNSLAQAAGTASLRDAAFIVKSKRWIANERKYLYSELLRVKNLTAFKPEANFILARIENGITAPELQRRLLSKCILIRDCSSFRGLGNEYFRISIKLRKQNSFLVSALKEALN